MTDHDPPPRATSTDPHTEIDIETDGAPGRAGGGSSVPPNTPHSVRQMYGEDRASHWLGMTIDDAGPDHAVVSMTITDKMVNGLGIGHGGLVFALADSAMAFATNTTGQPAVAVNAEIDWLRPARLGSRLTATARRIHDQGRSAITDVTVTDETGAKVAVFRGRTRLVKAVPSN